MEKEELLLLLFVCVCVYFHIKDQFILFIHRDSIQFHHHLCNALMYGNHANIILVHENQPISLATLRGTVWFKLILNDVFIVYTNTMYPISSIENIEEKQIIENILLYIHRKSFSFPLFFSIIYFVLLFVCVCVSASY